MDDTTIITDADYGVVIGGASNVGVITGTSILNRANSVTAGALYGAINPVSGGAVRTYWNGRGELVQEYIPAKALYAEPEAKPRKPPPALPVEAWATREFDAEQAHAVTLSLCRGQ